MHKHSNHLASESSPYLLQHAHNPVDWFPWGPEALNRAKDEDKPILVSIGYAACHWCHVMERESFENEETAKLMNDSFINIKIDREERPDLDHIYMDAVQAMTGSGGWPLNAFLTPEGKPFFGGTYFPPVPAHNRMSWPQVLKLVRQAFDEKRNEVDAQAENLTDHLRSGAFGLAQVSDRHQLFNMGKLDEAFRNIMNAADSEWGGFGKAPKFPQTFTIQFLFRYHFVKRGVEEQKQEQKEEQAAPAGAERRQEQEQEQSEKQSEGEEALRQGLLSLDKMIHGGIYDQVGGGFARYSTDTEWLAPHFEKMLYDNALLVSTISEAYQITKKREYRDIIEETVGFVKRELSHPEGGFYSALDADSEGEEGKFYTWTKAEVDRLLEEDAKLFGEYYDISEAGNWEEPHTIGEGKNILRVLLSLEEFARERQLDVETLRSLIGRGKKNLLKGRGGRVRPLLDDKILLGWNAMMNSALSKAFMATGVGEYKEMAMVNMKFLLAKFENDESGDLFHTWKEERAKYPAFLDDYALIIKALIDLQEITGSKEWLLKARDLTERVIERFSEEETPFFYYTNVGQEDVIVRKREIYDGAVPSGNSVMATNLHHLGLLFDRFEWRDRAKEMLDAIGLVATKYPTSFGIWACLLQEVITGTSEIAIIGKSNERLRRELYAEFLPYRVLLTSNNTDKNFPLLSGKVEDENALIYLCKDYVCQQPVDTIERFMSLINRGKMVN
ncbi:MAG: thioredoxin domain-containing protein [Chitinophagaceae bacterium]|nr:thioredoxin domain-containing protein [Chitinophagaceae bacterium]